MTSLTEYDYDIFMSHSPKEADAAWTVSLGNYLELEEWQGRTLKVFCRAWDTAPGEGVSEEIESALRRSRKIGLVLTPDTVAFELDAVERFVKTYVDDAERREQLIILTLFGCGIPPLLQDAEVVIFRDDEYFDDNLQIFLALVKDEPGPLETSILMKHGRYEEARLEYERLLPIFKEAGQDEGIGGILHQLGVIAQVQGRIEDAERFYDESLAITRRLDLQQGIAHTLYQQGTIAQNQDRTEDARRLYTESLAISRRIDDLPYVATASYHLGTLAQHRGAMTEARPFFNESLRVSKQIGDESSIASNLHHLGLLAQHRKVEAEAHRLFKESLKIQRKIGDEYGIAHNLMQLALLAINTKRIKEAVSMLRQAHTIFEKLNAPDAETTRQALKRLKKYA